MGLKELRLELMTFGERRSSNALHTHTLLITQIQCEKVLLISVKKIVNNTIWYLDDIIPHYIPNTLKKNGIS